MPIPFRVAAAFVPEQSSSNRRSEQTEKLPAECPFRFDNWMEAAEGALSRDRDAEDQPQMEHLFLSSIAHSSPFPLWFNSREDSTGGGWDVWESNSWSGFSFFFSVSFAGAVLSVREDGILGGWWGRRGLRERIVIVDMRCEFGIFWGLLLWVIMLMF